MSNAKIQFTVLLHSSYVEENETDPNSRNTILFYFTSPTSYSSFYEAQHFLSLLNYILYKVLYLKCWTNTFEFKTNYFISIF